MEVTILLAVENGGIVDFWNSCESVSYLGDNNNNPTEKLCFMPNNHPSTPAMDQLPAKNGAFSQLSSQPALTPNSMQTSTQSPDQPPVLPALTPSAMKTSTQSLDQSQVPPAQTPKAMQTSTQCADQAVPSPSAPSRPTSFPFANSSYPGKSSEFSDVKILDKNYIFYLCN